MATQTIKFEIEQPQDITLCIIPEILRTEGGGSGGAGYSAELIITDPTSESVPGTLDRQDAVNADNATRILNNNNELTNQALLIDDNRLAIADNSNAIANFDSTSLSITSPSTESISGTAVTQNATNIEFVNAINAIDVSSYVQKSGDTMAGDLEFNESNIKFLVDDGLGGTEETAAISIGEYNQLVISSEVAYVVDAPQLYITNAAEFEGSFLGVGENGEVVYTTLDLEKKEWSDEITTPITINNITENDLLSVTVDDSFNNGYIEWNVYGTVPYWRTVTARLYVNSEIVGEGSVTNDGLYNFSNSVPITTTILSGDTFKITIESDVPGYEVTGYSIKIVKYGVGNELDFADLTPQDSYTYKDGRIYYDSNEHTLTFYNDIEDISLQVGEELRARLTNTNAYTLENAKVGYIKGSAGTTLDSDYAIANDITQAQRTLGLYTHDILSGEDGYIVRYGAVRGVDTSAWTAGDVLYLSPDDAGEMINYRPRAPYYPIRIGLVLYEDATDGVIAVDTISFNGTDTNVNSEGFLNGIVTQTPEVTFVVDTGVVYAEVRNQNSTTENLPFILDGDTYFLNTTTNTGTDGRARVALTSGLVNDPQLHFMYIELDSGTPTLTTSTTGAPTDSAWIGICSLLDSTTTNSDGIFSFQRFNNSVSTEAGDGQINYITERLRFEGAKWFSGIEPTISINTTPSPDEITFTTTSGLAYQLHLQGFDASDGTEFYIANHPTEPFKKISSFSDIDVDASGNALSDNDRCVFTILGLQNSSGADDKILINLPTEWYSNTDNAIKDSDNFAVTGVPNGSGISSNTIRICRLVLRYDTNGGGQWTNLLGDGNYYDERGFPLGTGGGGVGSSSATTQFSDANFAVYNATDPTKFVQLDVSGVTTATTRTLDIPDKDGEIALKSKNVSTKTADYTIVSSDNDSIIEVNGTYTITLSSQEIGFNFTIVNVGTGTITITSSNNINGAATDITNSTQYSAISVYHTTADDVIAIGNLD